VHPYSPYLKLTHFIANQVVLKIFISLSSENPTSMILVSIWDEVANTYEGNC